MTKSKHKHIFQPCLLKSTDLYRNNITICKTAYCEICGKLNQYAELGRLFIVSEEEWKTRKKEILGDYYGLETFEVKNAVKAKNIYE